MNHLITVQHYPIYRAGVGIWDFTFSEQSSIRRAQHERNWTGAYAASLGALPADVFA